MSDGPSLPATPFTDAERVDIRRFCGYPAYGPGASGFQGWRFFEAFGSLEYRISNMAPAEAQAVRRYLAALRQFEDDYRGVRAQMGTAVAAVWTRNPREVSERLRLFREEREALCGFLGLPPGPDLQRAAEGGRIVV